VVAETPEQIDSARRQLGEGDAATIAALASSLQKEHPKASSGAICDQATSHRSHAPQTSVYNRGTAANLLEAALGFLLGVAIVVVISMLVAAWLS
jgi:hypothetical protein